MSSLADLWRNPPKITSLLQNYPAVEIGWVIGITYLKNLIKMLKNGRIEQ
jgi:hypothetical protein